MTSAKTDFWYKIWKEAGCPHTGVLLDIKKSTKKKYKSSIRRLKRKQNQLARNLPNPLQEETKQASGQQSNSSDVRLHPEHLLLMVVFVPLKLQISLLLICATS